MTIDTGRGIAYIPLGSPSYDYYGADRLGANLFGTSIVALDARTGKRRWHFQLVHHDLWDMDPSAAPQLTTIRHNGRNRDVVVEDGKTAGSTCSTARQVNLSGLSRSVRFRNPKCRAKRVGRRSRIRPNPPPFVKQSFTVDDVSPYLSADSNRDVREAPGGSE